MWPSALGNMGYVSVKILRKNKNIREFQRIAFSIINIINLGYDFFLLHLLATVNDAHITFPMLTCSWILMIEKDVRYNSRIFWFLLRILTKTYPIFPRALGHIQISMMHQNKSTSMGIQHTKGF